MSRRHQLSREHRHTLEQESSISKDVIRERGYWTATKRDELLELGYAGYQARVPALVIPLYDVTGRRWWCQIRPDKPRLNRDGKPVKYEVPSDTGPMVDVPPRISRLDWLNDRDRPLVYTEGSKKADAGVSRGLATVSLPGVWGWRDPDGVLPDVRDFPGLRDRAVCLAFDSDAMQKREVHLALTRFAGVLRRLHALVLFVHLPAGPRGRKVGLDDWFAAGGTPAEFLKLATEELRQPKCGAFPLTDVGNGERMAAEHRGQVLYCHQRRLWYVATRTHHAPDRTETAARLAKQTARGILQEADAVKKEEDQQKIRAHWYKTETQRGIDAMVKSARSEQGVAISEDVFDTDPYELNAQNGVVCLKTGDLRPRDPVNDLFDYVLPFAYDPDAKCPRWDRFLKEVLPDAELRAFVKRAMGYSLTGVCPEQCFFYLWGLGSNGKDVFLNILRSLLGPFARNAQFKTFLSKKHDQRSTDIARLRNARFIVATEPNASDQLNEGVIKNLTGESRVTGYQLYRGEVEFDMTGKIWVAANHKVRIIGTDEGIWRRVKLVPFLTTFEGKRKTKTTLPRDDQLRGKLLKELPGIFASAVRSCVDWHKHGLGSCRLVEEHVKEYRKAEDVLGDFLDQWTLQQPGVEVTVDKLYQRYQGWAAGEGIRYPLSKKGLGKKLRDLEFKQPPGGVRRWLGLRLLAWNEAHGGEER